MGLCKANPVDKWKPWTRQRRSLDAAGNRCPLTDHGEAGQGHGHGGRFPLCVSYTPSLNMAIGRSTQDGAAPTAPDAVQMPRRTGEASSVCASSTGHGEGPQKPRRSPQDAPQIAGRGKHRLTLGRCTQPTEQPRTQRRKSRTIIYRIWFNVRVFDISIDTAYCDTLPMV